MGRAWYQVRVRERIGLGQWIKKSKFFFARSSGDAAKKYRGGGTVMWAEKVGRDRLIGVGDFFKLGDKLLKEFREENKTRRYDGKEKETPYESG